MRPFFVFDGSVFLIGSAKSVYPGSGQSVLASGGALFWLGVAVRPFPEDADQRDILSDSRTRFR